MGYHDVRLGLRAMTNLGVEAEIRHAYQTARRVKGLRGRAAFLQACQAYATLCPDVSDHLIPRHVARILNPCLKLDASGSPTCRPTLN